MCVWFEISPLRYFRHTNLTFVFLNTYYMGINSHHFLTINLPERTNPGTKNGHILKINQSEPILIYDESKLKYTFITFDK